MTINLRQLISRDRLRSLNLDEDVLLHRIIPDSQVSISLLRLTILTATRHSVRPINGTTLQ
jgi:hypothetical protein